MRRLFSTIFLATILCMGVPHVLVAGGMHVSGDVSGVWPAGEVVSVDGPIFVAPGKSLVIEPGVRISFKTDAAFVVEGSLSAQGTAEAPIVLVPMENWAGFRFMQNGNDIRELHFVTISSDAGTPANVVIADNSLVVIEGCDFRAHKSCVWFTRGRIWAEHNFFKTVDLFSKTVWLDRLYNEIGNPCDNVVGNHFRNNLVTATASGDPDWSDRRITVGLWIDGSTNTCLSGNAVTVTAPGNALGVYVGAPDSVGVSLWTLKFCVVTVHGLDGLCKGIVNGNSGALNVVRCTIDVAATGDRDPAGVVASGPAQIIVNSTVVRIDRGSYYYVTLDGQAAMSVDYSDQWRVPGASDGVAGPKGHHGDRDPDYSTQSVVYGHHVYFEDPNMRLEGEWGQWHTLDEVQAYYGVVSPSPCIDHGDTLYSGWDPDRTLPDIGRYYFDQTANATGPDRGLPRPVDMVLSPPYPNPFNATTVIPFALNRTGEVRVIVHDILGREVAVLSAGKFTAGNHEIQFAGENLPSGLYIVTVHFNGSPVASRSMTLLK